MPGHHSKLSPSSASRWLACPGSIAATEHLPDSAGIAAEEGTLAHEIAEAMLGLAAGLVTKKEHDKVLKAAKKHKLYHKSMLDHGTAYAAFCMEKYNEAQVRSGGKAILILETRVSLERWVPEKDNGGTTDCTIVAPGEIDVCDYKYGKGVEVSAFENKQLMLYGLGSIEAQELIYDIDIVRLHIFQPRLANYDSYETTAEALLKWGDEVVRPKATEALSEGGSFAAGSHCRFCKIRAVCKTNAAYHEISDSLYTAQPHTLDEVTLSGIFLKAKDAIDWLGAVQTYMLELASKGQQWPGLKLVRGRANRFYKDEEAVIKVLKENDYSEDDYLNKKIVGIGDMESLLGAKKFESLIGAHIGKPLGKPVLVAESDKREKMSLKPSATEEFAEVDLEHQF